jgi:hypothetical protein
MSREEQVGMIFYHRLLSAVAAGLGLLGTAYAAYFALCRVPTLDHFQLISVA